MALCGERECGSGEMSHAVDMHRGRASTLRFRDQLRLPGEEVAYSDADGEVEVEVEGIPMAGQVMEQEARGTKSTQEGWSL